MDYHNMDSESILKKFDSDLEEGLDQKSIEEKQKKFGLNELQEEEKPSLLTKLMAQFKDFLVLILIGAALISFFLGEKTDAVVIIAIVIINAFLGIYQEGRAEKALEALKKMSAPESKVIRGGLVQKIESNQLVPGDIVLIEAGDIVPADLRLVDSSNLKIDESSLTGESLAVEKNSEKIERSDIALGDRHNMAYMSSIVSYGRGKAIVVGTGHDTEIGKIASMIQGYEQEATPLQKKLDELGKYIGLACIAVCILVFIIGKMQARGTAEMFMTAISLAVAAIPEGLPAIVTIVLALGMTKMVEKNAIVKRLLAVETLGCTTVICSDKTGTLTQNEMTVTKLYTNGEVVDITGTGYIPKGQFLRDGEEVEINNFNYKTLLSIASLCNDSILEDKSEDYKIIGDPTEGALIVLAEKAGIKKEDLVKSFPRIDEKPFDSSRKMMTTIHKDYLPNKLASFTKGAPDLVIDRCDKILIDGEIQRFDDEKKKEVLETNSKFAQSALRVLALAFKMNSHDYQLEEAENNMIFVGLVGMIDPPREEAKESIKLCREAGIKTVMITGDYKETAYAIAHELGIADDPSQAIMGNELDTMHDAELRDLVQEKRVYARVSPQHKVKIIQALKDNGEIAAMTGDGVNDALALKKADIGIAMGITGTDVAKNTAEVILTDDNFSSIVSAVEEGRIIYSNIKKFVFFLLSCNLGEILIILMSILFKWPIPLLPIQLLWLNLITDSFPALALGLEKGHGGIMQEAPRDPDEPIIDKKMRRGIIVQSSAIAIGTLLAFKWGLTKYPDSPDFMMPRTIAFTSLILAELLRAFSSRSQSHSIFEIGIFTNRSLNIAVGISFALLLGVLYLPILQPIFHTLPLGPEEWKIVALFSFIPLVLGEVQKKILKNK